MTPESHLLCVKARSGRSYEVSNHGGNTIPVLMGNSKYGGYESQDCPSRQRVGKWWHLSPNSHQLLAKGFPVKRKSTGTCGQDRLWFNP